MAVVLGGCGAIEPRSGSKPESAIQPASETEAAAAAPAPGKDDRVDSGSGLRPVPAQESSSRPWYAGGALNLDVYGLSYHLDREAVQQAHVDNEVNYGLGLSYEFRNDARGIGFVQAGVYYDSGRNWAKIAGPGYQYKLGDRWRAGAALLVFDSATYNHGRIFVAPIPILTYDFRTFKLNAAYAPKVSDYSASAAFALYISVPLPTGTK